MLNFFKSNKINRLVFLTILIFGSQIPVIFGESTYDLSGNSFLTQLIFSKLYSPENQTLLYILTGFVLSFVVFFSIYYINKFRLLLDNNFLYGYLFLFFIILLPHSPLFLIDLVSMSLIIAAVFTLQLAYFEDSSSFDYFNAATLLSLASLINHHLVLFFFLIPLAFINAGKGKYKEILAALFGFLTPLYLLFGIHFFVVGNFIVSPLPFSNLIPTFKSIPSFEYTEIAGIGFTALLLLFGIVHTSVKYSALNNSHKDSFKFLLHSFLLTLLMVVLYPSKTEYFIPIMAFLTVVPTTLFFNNPEKKIFKEIVFDSLLLFIIISYLL
ncbi:MAG: hypothetical protein U9N85_11285 [Bacteroidota bacterium]|nr:hypothetical protein [Bacteroidota bacterium]